jgi:hypothetical protein
VNGDIAAINAGALLLSENQQSARVEDGNLRTFEGASIGSLTGTLLGLGPVLDVPSGSVGLVRARTGTLLLNFVGTGTTPPLDRRATTRWSTARRPCSSTSSPTAGSASSAPATWRRAPPSVFFADFDKLRPRRAHRPDRRRQRPRHARRRRPGDLHRHRGNVRYIRVGGETFIDRQFGSGAPVEYRLRPGETVDIIDDSGSILRLIPAGPVANPFAGQIATGGGGGTGGGPGGGGAPPAAGWWRRGRGAGRGANIEPDFLFPDPASISVLAYPIRSGGVSVLQVTTDDTLIVEGVGNLGNATGEVGRIFISGEGIRNVAPPVIPTSPSPRRRRGILRPVLRHPRNNTGFDPVNPAAAATSASPTTATRPTR